MSELTDRAKAVLDNLKGSTFAPARAAQIAQDFINDDSLTADETAQEFLDGLTAYVRRIVNRNVLRAEAAANESEIQAAGDLAVSDL